MRKINNSRGVWRNAVNVKLCANALRECGTAGFLFYNKQPFNDKDEHISGRWVSMNGCF